MGFSGFQTKTPADENAWFINCSVIPLVVNETGTVIIKRKGRDSGWLEEHDEALLTIADNPDNCTKNGRFKWIKIAEMMEEELGIPFGKDQCRHHHRYLTTARALKLAEEQAKEEEEEEAKRQE
jgi:hypothetical protein